jgi:hypothetical protein
MEHHSSMLTIYSPPNLWCAAARFIILEHKKVPIGRKQYISCFMPTDGHALLYQHKKAT